MWSACRDCEVSIYTLFEESDRSTLCIKAFCVCVDDNDVQYPRKGRRITVYEIKYNIYIYIYYLFIECVRKL
jgi:hypothetical protein